VIFAALVLTLLGYLLGSRLNGMQWHEGDAYVFGQDQATIEGGALGYGISSSVAWIARDGELHSHGWPECLNVPDNNTVGELRFATVNVEVPGRRWREVVLVDCSTR
jgi:hypothetical protein